MLLHQGLSLTMKGAFILKHIMWLSFAATTSTDPTFKLCILKNEEQRTTRSFQNKWTVRLWQHEFSFRRDFFLFLSKNNRHQNVSHFPRGWMTPGFCVLCGVFFSPSGALIWCLRFLYVVGSKWQRAMKSQKKAVSSLLRQWYKLTKSSFIVGTFPCRKALFLTQPCMTHLSRCCRQHLECMSRLWSAYLGSGRDVAIVHTFILLILTDSVH